jgi:hypothetical protein
MYRTGAADSTSAALSLVRFTSPLPPVSCCSGSAGTVPNRHAASWHRAAVEGGQVVLRPLGLCAAPGPPPALLLRHQLHNLRTEPQPRPSTYCLEVWSCGTITGITIERRAGGTSNITVNLTVSSAMHVLDQFDCQTLLMFNTAQHWHVFEASMYATRHARAANLSCRGARNPDIMLSDTHDTRMAACMTTFGRASSAEVLAVIAL